MMSTPRTSRFISTATAAARVAALALLVLCCTSRSAFGQAAWEFKPYEVSIWLALPDDPTWQEGQLAQLRSILLGRAETAFGPVWNCQVDAAPPAIAADIRHGLQELKLEQVEAAVPKGAQVDKIYLVAVNDDQ